MICGIRLACYHQMLVLVPQQLEPISDIHGDDSDKHIVYAIAQNTTYVAEYFDSVLTCTDALFSCFQVI